MTKKKEISLIKNYLQKKSNIAYLSKHFDFVQFSMPKSFYFKVLTDSMDIHWAIIKTLNGITNIYFINSWGRIFDKLEYSNEIKAKRDLRKNGFDFSTNRYCPFLPANPLYINLSYGKKSALYSKGTCWKSVKRTKNYYKRMDKYIKHFIKRISVYMK